MTQHIDVIYPNELGRYTRTDFAALRAWLSGVAAATVLRLYYGEERFAETREMEKFLAHMREELIARLIDRNPRTAESLQKFRLSFKWGKVALDYLIAAADAKTVAPRPDDPASAWFKPIAAKRLAGDGIKTMAALMDVIRRRGKGWYRPIPALGAGKARRIEAWLQSHAASLGALPASLSASGTEQAPAAVLERFSPNLPALERFRPASGLDGSAGLNRHPQRPLISARDDYDAILAYLYKFRGRDKTHDNYRKEVERFLLWCITERGRAMSDLMVDDCEAYRDFLAAIPARWIGLRRPRTSPDWRPFAAQLSVKSQNYAMQVCRALFSYLVDVRYLAANPFKAVSAAPATLDVYPMQIARALSAELWAKLAGPGGILDQLCALPEAALVERYHLRPINSGVPRIAPAPAQHAAQLRIFRVIVLVLGATGIRREELATATRDRLQASVGESPLWRLAVLGKRRRWRYVYLTGREIQALAAHWAYRGEDFSRPESRPLVSPVFAPAARRAREETAENGGFSVSGLGKLASTWRRRIAADDELDLTPEERQKIACLGLHALRHTMATLAVEGDMPLQVVQAALGHASLNTTSIYARSAERTSEKAFRAWRSKGVRTS